jgi:hypothetical protein
MMRMMPPHGMRGSGITVRAIVALALLSLIILGSLNFGILVLGAFEATLSTDKVEYMPGEVVTFSGTKYDPTSVYKIWIIILDKEGKEVIVTKLPSFTPDVEGKIPPDVTWAIAFDVEYDMERDYIARVYDSMDNPTTAKTTFHVYSTHKFLVKLLDDMTALVETNVVDGTGIDDSLLASLTNSIRKLESASALYTDERDQTAANQLRAARNMMTAFVHKVLAQSGKSIDDGTAGELLDKATAFIGCVDSQIVSSLLPLGKRLALNVGRTLAKQEAHMARFMIRKGMGDTVTDEEALALANATQGEIEALLAELKGRSREARGRWENGTLDYVSLLMELERDNVTAEGVRAAAGLVMEELSARGATKPGFGQVMKALRGMVDDSGDTMKGMGELMSEAHSKGDRGHDDKVKHNGPKDNDPKDNGNGHSKGKGGG